MGTIEKRHLLYYAAIAIVFAAAGGAAGYFFAISHGGGRVDADITRQGGYEFINPLLSCDISEDVPYGGFSRLKNVFIATESRLKQQNLVTRIGVYFRALDSGYWTGLNENDGFMPASLGKVPLAIAVYQQTPRASLPDQPIFLPQGTNLNTSEAYPPPHPLALGRSYALQDLLNAMLQGSDNNAMQALLGYVSTSTLDDVYGNFALPFSEDQDALSPKLYSRVFRILYNASYLPRLKSQDVLRSLAGSDFHTGISAALPKGMTVSHKFGERTVFDMTGKVIKRELHDCGIVYYPKTPYLICVMTEGANFSDLEQAIQTMSLDAYQAVQNGLLASPGN